MKNDEFTKLFKYMQKIEKKVDRGFEQTATKAELNKLINTIDGFVKRLDDIETENTAGTSILKRHARWIEQIATKTGVKLT